MAAGRRFGEGKETQEEIGVELGVNRYTVTKWHKRWKAEGEAGLVGVQHPGAAAKLGSKKLAELLEKLKGGAKAFGYEGDNWTAKRVAEVIRRETKVEYHPEHVRRLLRAKGWTPQKAVGKPQERNDAVIRDWADKTVPELVKKNRRGPP